jgi:hypothetical protein
MKLPLSFSYDSILTITNYDCSKAIFLLPCKKIIGTEKLAQTYFSKVFPHYGIPDKIISDKDFRLTSKLAKKICQITKIDQNISTAYHSQTDRQFERMNQMLRTYLRIFCNEQYDNWAKWIPMAQYVINSQPLYITKIPPYEVLIREIPKGQFLLQWNVTPMNKQQVQLQKIQNRA